MLFIVCGAQAKDFKRHGEKIDVNAPATWKFNSKSAWSDEIILDDIAKKEGGEKSRKIEALNLPIVSITRDPSVISPKVVLDASIVIKRDGVNIELRNHNALPRLKYIISYISNVYSHFESIGEVTKVTLGGREGYLSTNRNTVTNSQGITYYEDFKVYLFKKETGDVPYFLYIGVSTPFVSESEEYSKEELSEIQNIEKEVESILNNIKLI